MLRLIVMSGVLVLCCCGPARAQPEGFVGAVAKAKSETLFAFSPQPALQGKLPRKCRLIPLPDLEFTGPKPSHPFVLGNFYADARWGIVNGSLGVLDGKNGALQIAWADQFCLEGIMEQGGLGGWFLLLGWDEGRGFAVSNVTLKDSGSPWFVTEFRGGKAIEGRSQEFEKFEWKGEQPFRLVMEESRLTFEIGRHRQFHELPIEGYAPGRIILGTYDTRYGPRPLLVKSLKLRAIEGAVSK